MQAVFQAVWTHVEPKRLMDFSVVGLPFVYLKIFDNVFLSPHLTLFLVLIHSEALSLWRPVLLGQILSSTFFPPKNAPTKSKRLLLTLMSFLEMQGSAAGVSPVFFTCV